MSAAPNCIGAWWSYTDAIAKSVDELNSVILSGLKKQNIDPKNKALFIKVTVKDGADGLGDVSEYKQKSDTFLPTKASRYTYAVLKREAFVGEDKYLCVEESPNSIRCNQLLLQAICDENESSSMVLTLCPSETERKLMSDSYMIQAELKFKFHLINSMVDEKRSRADGGLQGSGSLYMCDLCKATHETAKTKLGTFRICRNLQETKEIAELLCTVQTLRN